MRANTRTKDLRNVQKYQKYKQRKGRRQQHGSFLNRYDFAYAGWDTVKQAMKGLDSLAPKLINQTSGEIDEIAVARVKQVLNDGGQQIQKITPQIIRGAIGDVYKTLFRLLGNLDKKKFAQLKTKLSKIGIKWTK